MKRLNVAISDQADDVIIATKKKKGFANKDETIDFIIQDYGTKNK